MTRYYSTYRIMIPLHSVIPAMTVVRLCVVADCVGLYVLLLPSQLSTELTSQLPWTPTSRSRFPRTQPCSLLLRLTCQSTKTHCARPWLGHTAVQLFSAAPTSPMWQLSEWTPIRVFSMEVVGRGIRQELPTAVGGVKVGIFSVFPDMDSTCIRLLPRHNGSNTYLACVAL